VKNEGYLIFSMREKYFDKLGHKEQLDEMVAHN
jgi:hypothetical protein